MKKIFLCAILALAVNGFAVARADDAPAPKEVTVGINDAYIPNGFDSGSDAFVVVNGLFPNSCYHLKDSEVVHKSDLVHEVRAKALVSQGMCLMVLVPFSKEVQLGKLRSGTHSIQFVSGDGTYMERKLVIE